jgi:hypothetical protein
MLRIEILHRLEQLPAGTPVTATHVAALADVLSPPLPPEFSGGLEERLGGGLIDAVTLADELKEPPSTLKGWEIGPGDTGYSAEWKSVRYRVEPVQDWFRSRIVRGDAELTDSGWADQGNVAVEDGQIYKWGDPHPVIVADGAMTGFFDSLHRQAEPQGFRTIRIAAMATMSALTVPTDDLNQVSKSLDALMRFGDKVVSAPDEAMAIFDAWKGKALPQVLYLFLYQSLGRNGNMARAILKELGTGFFESRFNIASWLYERMLEHGFCGLDIAELDFAITIATQAGVPINQNSRVRGKDGDVLFHGSIAHLLADTMGSYFRLRPLDECTGKYNGFLVNALFDGLGADRPNYTGLTARTMGEEIDEKHGKGRSEFLAVLNKYEFNRKMNATLNTTKAKKNFIDKS